MMDIHTATEEAYKRGYEQGKKDAVVHGRWIQEYRIEEMRYSPDDIERYKVPDGFSCSICSKWNSAKTNYCPNRGARMDGE